MLSVNLIIWDICHGSRQMYLPSVKNHLGFASFQESKEFDFLHAEQSPEQWDSGMV